MEPNPSRNRSYETEHIAESIDTLRIERFGLTGTKYFDRTYHRGSEQFHYSPSHVCNDTVGYRKRDNPLSLSHEVGVPCVVSFTATDTRNQYDLEGNLFGTQKDTHSFYAWGPNNHNVAIDEPDESDEEYMTRAIAGLNPSRADSQGAAFIAELRELPSLFEGLGKAILHNGFLRGSAGGHLTVQFGWAPVIRDLKKFFTETDKVRNRLRTLQELRGKGKIRRQFKEKDGRGTQVKHFTSRSSFTYTVDVGPYSIEERTIHFDVHTEMRTTRWAIVEFINDVPSTLFPASDDARWDEAHSLVYGTNVDGPTLWQLMPWSWLIDWTSNASEFIKSQNNVAGHKLGKTILMKETHRITTTTPVMDEYPPFNGIWSYSFLPGRLETVTKERILDVQPTVKYTNEVDTILGSEFKTSILASLFIQRFKPLR